MLEHQILHNSTNKEFFNVERSSDTMSNEADILGINPITSRIYYVGIINRSLALRMK